MAAPEWSGVEEDLWPHPSDEFGDFVSVWSTLADNVDEVLRRSFGESLASVSKVSPTSYIFLLGGNPPDGWQCLADDLAADLRAEFRGVDVDTELIDGAERGMIGLELTARKDREQVHVEVKIDEGNEIQGVVEAGVPMWPDSLLVQ